MRFHHRFPLLLLGTALCACTRLDVASQHYPTYAAARDAGALSEGAWLPKGLPDSSFNIDLTVDVDTNEVWIIYSDATGRLPADCAHIAAAGMPKGRRDGVEEIEQFERELRGLVRGQSFHCRGEEYSYYVAIDPRSSRIFGWSLGDTHRHE